MVHLLEVLWVWPTLVLVEVEVELLQTPLLLEVLHNLVVVVEVLLHLTRLQTVLLEVVL